MPARRHDEIGELTELVSMLSAFFLKTTDQNAALMQEKSLFMTIAAHQLRTPLTGLLWSIDSLLDPSITVDARQKLLIDTDGMLKRMRLIVNHILASANVEGGKFGYVFEQIDIVPVITKLIEEFKPVSDNHGVALRLETGEGLFPIYADAERITLALFDLISNAIDYTPKGGTVTISVAPQQDRLEIAIADTGMGISELELPLLFTKFYRSDRARHVRPDGSGLGLFLVKDVVSSHGSDMKVTSKEGVGSRFSFFLNSKKPE
jgi:signal transduction histidine kinase